MTRATTPTCEYGHWRPAHAGCPRCGPGGPCADPDYERLIQWQALPWYRRWLTPKPGSALPLPAAATPAQQAAHVLGSVPVGEMVGRCGWSDYAAAQRGLGAVITQLQASPVLAEPAAPSTPAPDTPSPHATVAAHLKAARNAARYVAVGDGYYDPYANHVQAVDAAADRAAATLRQAVNLLQSVARPHPPGCDWRAQALASRVVAAQALALLDQDALVAYPAPEEPAP